MKRIACLVLFFAAALLTSCNLNIESQGEKPQKDDTSVGFGVYMKRGVTTKAGYAGELTTEKLKTVANGFGVFSYYGNGALYNETSKPDFMYNQQVKFTTNGVWEYTPIKYWPNEYGAEAGSESADRLSFFAYAPYVEVTPSTGIVTASDNTDGILGMTRNIAAGDPMVMYGACLQPGGGVDLCWGVSADTFTSSVDGNKNNVQSGDPFIDVIKPKTGDRLTFEFNHALSQLNVQIDTDVDVESHATSTLDSKTRVYVRSVSFTGFTTRGSLNLNSKRGNPAWFDISGTGRLRRDPVTVYDGRSDGLEGVSTAADVNEEPAVLSPIIVQSKEFGTETPDEVSTGVTGKTVNLFAQAGSRPVADVNAPVMVVPIVGVPVTVTIVYDIETKDNNLSSFLSDGVTHGISIENKITKTVQIDGQNMTLKPGMRYVIGLHLGLTSVKFDAEVKTWDDSQYEGSAFLPVNTTVPTWDGTTEALKKIDDDNYVIENAAQLAQLAVDVNNGNTYEGKTITLMSDLDLNHLAWTPIGMSGSDAASDLVEAYVFCGTFDGNGKTISNLKVEQTGERGFAGLFGDIQTDNEVTIKDLTIKNVDIQGNHMAAGLLGRYVGLNSTGKLVVNNVTVSGGTITSTPWDNNGTAESGNQVGGIIGNGYWSGISIDNCAVRGVTITGVRDLGGIAGALGGPESFTNNTVENCTIQQDYPSNLEAGKNLTTVHEIVGRLQDPADWTIDNTNTASHVTINLVTLTSVAVNLDKSTVWLGETVLAPTVTATLSNGATTESGLTAVWSASPASVAEISDANSGAITLKGVGTATITASVTYQGVTKEGSAELNVNAVTGVSISPVDGDFTIGTSQVYTATLTFNNPINGTIADDDLPVVTWKHSNGVQLSPESSQSTRVNGAVVATTTATTTSGATAGENINVRAKVAATYTGNGEISALSERTFVAPPVSFRGYSISKGILKKDASGYSLTSGTDQFEIIGYYGNDSNLGVFYHRWSTLKNDLGADGDNIKADSENLPDGWCMPSYDDWGAILGVSEGITINGTAVNRGFAFIQIPNYQYGNQTFDLLGLLLIPDNTAISGVSNDLIGYIPNSGVIYETDEAFNRNLSLTDVQTLIGQGCVFFPCTGNGVSYDGGSTYDWESGPTSGSNILRGDYWMCTYALDGDDPIYRILTFSINSDPDNLVYMLGRSGWYDANDYMPVRLVKKLNNN